MNRRHLATKWLPGLKQDQHQRFLDFNQNVTHHKDIVAFVKEGLLARTEHGDYYFTERGHAVVRYLNG